MIHEVSWIVDITVRIAQYSSRGKTYVSQYIDEGLL